MARARPALRPRGRKRRLMRRRVTPPRGLLLVSEDAFERREAALVELRDGRARGVERGRGRRRVEPERRARGNAPGRAEIQSDWSLSLLPGAAEQGGEELEPLRVA